MILPTATRNVLYLQKGIHPNMLKAAVEAKSEGICHPILLGNDEAIGKLAEELDLSLEGIEIVNLRHPDESERRERYARILAENVHAKALLMKKPTIKCSNATTSV